MAQPNMKVPAAAEPRPASRPPSRPQAKASATRTGTATGRGRQHEGEGDGDGDDDAAHEAVGVEAIDRHGDLLTSCRWLRFALQETAWIAVPHAP